MNYRSSRSFLRRITLLLGLSAGTYAAHATVYHVATGNPGASDQNPGTEAEPFKTINGALPHLGPGDEVIVHAGVYREQIVLPPSDWHWEQRTYPAFPSGRSYSEMIAFIAKPGDEVTLSGSDPVSGWRRHEGSVWVRDDWMHNSQQMFCNGVVLRQIGGEMGGILQQYWSRKDESFEDLEPSEKIEFANPMGGNWTFRLPAAGSFLVNRDTKQLFVWLTEDRDPNQHLMEASIRPFHFSIGASFIRVAGFKMTHAGTSAIVNWPSIGIGGSHNILENVQQSWSDFAGIGIGGNNNTIRNSSFNYNGNNGMGGGGWGHRILDCETSYNNYRNWNLGWHSGGVKFIPHAHDLVMSGHRAFGNNGPGIWFDGWMSNVTIQNSVSAYNRSDGIFYEIGERGVIKNNVLYENGGRGVYVPDSSDTLIAHNVAVRNGMSGIVVVGNGRKGGVYGHAGDEVLFTRNNVVWGNLLMDNNWPDLAPRDWATRAELILPDERPSNLNNLSDYNLFFRKDGRELPFFLGWGARSFGTLEAWQEATGNDRNSIVAEPRFADFTARDFRPAPDSPALGRVHPHMSVRFDAGGAVRPDGGRAAGAFEGP